MRSVFIIAVLLLSDNCFSQNARQYTLNYNGWLMYFGAHKLSDKIGLHAEVQWRRSEMGVSPQQLLLRTGVNYHFNKQVFATAGYCFVETYPYGEFPVKATFPEHRIWEQLQFKAQIEKMEMITRLRQEQRYVYAPVLKDSVYKPGTDVYTNRTRLLLRVSIPLKGATIEDKSFFISVYDETFFNYGKNVGLNIFDQNRGYIALGYKIPKLGRFEIGYMNQLLFKADGVKVENNHTIMAGLTSGIDLFKKKD